MSKSFYSEEECEAVAQAANLRYVDSSKPGFSRKKFGRGYAYFDTQDKKITDKVILKRLKKIVIPPAYSDVWICPYKNGHIQATGIAKNLRKQYLYHEKWRAERSKQKFYQLLDFGEKIVSLRKKINVELSKPALLNKNQVLSAIVHLLDISCIRVGNKLYAKNNETFGVTTLRKKHLEISDKQIALNFYGKNSKLWHVILKDKKIVKIIKKCEEIPGYEIFKYFDAEGKKHTVTSQDVNNYLKYLTNMPFTAKDFRTWIACRETFWRMLKNLDSPITEIIKEVAQLLGHTPSVCKTSYIFPEIITWWNDKKFIIWAQQNATKLLAMSKEEAFIYWLKVVHHNV